MAWARWGLLSGFLLVGAAACTPPAEAQTSCAPGAPALIIYHAGSLTAAFTAVEKLFVAQTGACITDVSAGSVDLARRVTTGEEPCDIMASADFETIERILEPARAADYDIRFGEGAMVLAYTTASKNAATISSGNVPFNPPSSVPDAAADWVEQLTAPGVTIGASHPFLDPTGYRNDIIFQLAELEYGTANLYDTLLTHYDVVKPNDAVGKTYDYQIIYEHSALANFKADATGTYRYVHLPDAVNLGNPAFDRRYREASVRMPGLDIPAKARRVTIPGSRTIWGITIMKTAPHQATAIQFLQLLFGPQGVAAQTAAGPQPITPPLVEREDFPHLPPALRAVVKIDSDDQRGSDRDGGHPGDR